MSLTDALPITVSVPEYGFVAFGLGTNPSYEAARRGDFPTLEYGLGDKVKRKRVPVRVALQRLAGNDQALLEALSRDFIAKLKIFREDNRKREAVS
jgi:hypothetical protein